MTGAAEQREQLRDRTRRFIGDVVIGYEQRDPGGGHGIAEDLRHELQARGRESGLFAPHVAPRFGGLGLDARGQSVVFEEAGYSLLGPLALNCAAPDEGNMHLLAEVASPDQQERYLAPLAAGDVRSCFAMTEPHPGAGSDPAMLRTTATRTKRGWRINGHKWFVTGASGAAFAIVMARTADAISHDEGATMLIVEAGSAGYRVTRQIDSMDSAFVGGHCELLFEDCVVPDDAVLGEAGLGYRYAQVRLGPARLTHCMRWLGLARRALDVALDRAAEREAFGARLDQHGLVQGMIANSVIDIEASRALIGRAAGALDRGGRAGQETSVAKVFVAESVGRVVDSAVQICGALGVSGDAQLARYYAEVRPFRIYDGPSETHRWSIARRAARNRARERG